VAERLLLVGMMAAGKSTVARLTAKRLGWSWVDTDQVVVGESGATIPELFARHGEVHFRQEEARALGSVLRRDDPVVVSVGGGVVLDEGNRAALRSAGTVVWLRARPDTLVERMRDGAGRPLLVGDSPQARAETLRLLDADRRPLYEEVAEYVVDVDGMDPRAVVERLLHTVGLETSDREAHR
jgi:shikimate kinase